MGGARLERAETLRPAVGRLQNRREDIRKAIGIVADDLLAAVRRRIVVHDDLEPIVGLLRHQRIEAAGDI